MSGTTSAAKNEADKPANTLTPSVETAVEPDAVHEFGPDLGELSEKEAAYLDRYPNDNTERALAVEIVRLSRKG